MPSSAFILVCCDSDALQAAVESTLWSHLREPIILGRSTQLITVSEKRLNLNPSHVQSLLDCFSRYQVGFSKSYVRDYCVMRVRQKGTQSKRNCYHGANVQCKEAEAADVEMLQACGHALSGVAVSAQ
jgi:hypothetical protein